MFRRYSSADKNKCYNCNKQFQNNQLQTIFVIKRNDDFQQRHVCQHCLQQNYVECYHDEQHRDTVLPFLDLSDESSYVELDGNYYCMSCAKKYIVKCENCFQNLDVDDNKTYEHDGQYYCEDCFYEQFCSCQDCGQVMRRDDAIFTYDNRDHEIIVCENCADSYIEQCYGCADYININHDEHFYTHDGYTICQRCYLDDYFTCDRCYEIFDRNSQFGGINDNGIYCQDCWIEQGGRQIHHKDQVDPQEQDQRVQYDYGTKIKPKLKKRITEQETKEYIGVELQLQNDNRDAEETTKFIDEVSKNRKLICKADGSLDSAYGVQINTFPCTYNYHLKSFGWQQVFKVINEYNMTDISNAGLHFHISKNNFSADEQKALDYFVNNCSRTLGTIGGRDYSQNTYCKAKPDKKEDQWGQNSNRYQAVNFQNTNTIQLRFPAATADYNEFKKRLRMVHNICKIVKLFSFDDIKTLDEQNLTYLFVEIIKEI